MPAQPLDKRTTYFLLLMALHTSLLVTSTIAGSKVFALPFGLSASATVFSYMMTFVMLDSIAELYGRAYSHAVIHLGLIGMAISAVYYEFAIILPPAPFWNDQHAFEAILGSSWRIWAGGWIAYMVSQHLDLWSFLKLKAVAKGRGSLLFRSWVSMLLGQLVDTTIFVIIAFYGTDPVVPIIIGQYLVKVLFATCASPLVSGAVAIGRNFTDKADESGLAPQKVPN